MVTCYCKRPTGTHIPSFRRVLSMLRLGISKHSKICSATASLSETAGNPRANAEKITIPKKPKSPENYQLCHLSNPESIVVDNIKISYRRRE
ncbi:hypothetical protein J6590_017179 [Homalodisca vitripennis]|nr:hypothetical protein J6590_017179 [Homalodisca vitripennis]